MFLCRNKKNYPRIITKYSSLIPLVPLLQFLFVCMPVKCENVLYCLVLVCSSSLLLVLGERYALRFWSISCNFIYTIFDLITTHTPISAQSSHFVVIRLQPVYFLSTSYKGISCGYSFELHRLQVDAIQMCTRNICLYELIVLGFNDTSTLEGHFVSSPRKREKRDRRDSRGDERGGQGRKRNRNESEETEEIKTFPLYPYLLKG